MEHKYSFFNPLTTKTYKIELIKFLAECRLPPQIVKDILLRGG